MNMPCKMYKDKRITKQRSADIRPFAKKDSKIFKTI